MVKYGVLAVLSMLLSAVYCQTDATGTYVILAPKYLWEKYPYQLSVATFDWNGFSKLRFAIEGDSNDDQPVSLVKDVYLKRNQVQLVEIDTSILPSGTYKLSMLSGSGAEVNPPISLTTLDKIYSVLVQTDKPIYRPGNVVKFRVLLLDQATKPVAKPKTISVVLSDPDDNEIKKWPMAVLRNGVFQSQLEISNEPMPGNWSITANVYGMEHSFSFPVDNYKLPKHEIWISTAKQPNIKDKEFIVDVSALYTFGRPVKGNATVTVKSDSKKLTQYGRINGSMRLSFDLRRWLQQQTESERNISVDVDVVIRDRYMKENIEASKTFLIPVESYYINVKNSSKNFIPELPYDCTVQIRDPSGQQFEPIGNSAAHIAIYYSGDDKNHEMQRIPDKEGNIPLTLAPTENTNHIEVTINYHDSQSFFTVSKYPSGKILQASIVTEHDSLDTHIIRVQVQSAIPLDHLTYHIIAKGKILAVKQLHFEQTKSVLFEIAAEQEMFPSAKIFIFNVLDDQILSDTVPIVMRSLMNWVNVTLPRDKVQPGETVAVLVESTPNSVVGLLAVDRGALLMSDANQITKQRVLNEFKAFSDGIDGPDDEIEEMELITNAVSSPPGFGASARFGFYDPDESDEYIELRKKFPESWLWLDLLTTGADGKVNITDTVPDAITNWEITAFSLSPEHGLGVLDDPVSLAVSKPFFILINVPQAIKKSEIAVVNVVLFNELNTVCYVGVTLKNSRQEFEFVDNGGRKDASYQTKNVILQPKSTSTAQFYIKPKKMGNIVIKVVAESTEATDSVEQLLRVTPESLPYSGAQHRYIQMENETSFFNLVLKIPRHLDTNSESIYFSVDSNLLGDSVDLLEEMIRLPSGNCEQNALKMVPNVIVSDYMLNVGKVNVLVRNRAIKFLNMGYQNQLKFRHSDGSFSMYGAKDNSARVFLTALVAKTLQQAAQFITVDKKVIGKAFDWLQQKQATNGAFIEDGEVPEFGLVRKHEESVTLAAYTLIAFLEDDTIAQKYKSVIDKGAKYLSSRISNNTSIYAMALTAYALQLAHSYDHEHRYDHERAFSKLVEISHSDGEFRWWGDDTPTTEATAYGLLTYIERGVFIDPKSIFNWLISKWDSFGPDNIETTFVELQAIAKHAKKISPHRNNYEVTVLSGQRKLANLIVNPETSQTLRNIALPSNVRNFTVETRGTGTGTFSIHYQYKTNIFKLRPLYHLDVQVLDTSTVYYLDLQICTKFIPKESYEESRLALMEITFPSGYIAFDDSVAELEQNAAIQKVTTKHGDASLWLYFEKLPHDRALCLPVSGFRQSDVLQQIPGSVKVFDFYDNTRVAIKHFDARYNVCDVCENGCPPECKNSN